MFRANQYLSKNISMSYANSIRLAAMILCPIKELFAILVRQSSDWWKHMTFQQFMYTISVVYVGASP